MDLVIGKKSANVNLLTLYERKSKIGMAIRIYGKEAKTITKTLRYLQSVDKLIYGVNISQLQLIMVQSFMIERNLKNQYIMQKTILMYIFATHMHHEKKVELKILMD